MAPSCCFSEAPDKNCRAWFLSGRAVDHPDGPAAAAWNKFHDFLLKMQSRWAAKKGAMIALQSSARLQKNKQFLTEGWLIRFILYCIDEEG